MLSFKDNKDVKPLYDYYVETDLDNVDDQPVDYSKRYSESYEECRRTKTILKSNELQSEVPNTLKQSCNDEVKIYCIEGTPLTISYASSLSDLREVGTHCSIDKSDTKPDFPLVNADSFIDDSKKDPELLDSSNEESPLSKEKEEIKEGKNVSFRNSTDISKASSPLMFSRSSSIGSLTSFEQQSIIDDRSSVSAFSALTSGLISPSDLPDSPSELMSPTFAGKDSNSKIDVTKIDFDNECQNIESNEKEKSHPVQNFLTSVQDEISVDVQSSEPEVHVTLDSNQISEGDNGIVSQQLEVSNDSLDEVFENPGYENVSFSLQNEEELSSKSDDEESDDDDILLQQCIELGMPSNLNKSKQDLEVCPPHSQNVPASDLKTTDEIHPFDITACDERDKQKFINQSTDSEFPKELLVEIRNDSTEVDSKVADALKSDEDSEEDDELLQHCIQLGMPENMPNRIATNSKVCAKSIYPSQSTNYKSEKILDNQAGSKSDDDLDVDDIILQQCIELGMPKKSNKIVLSCPVSKTVECHRIDEKINSPQQYPVDRSRSYQPIHPNTNNTLPSAYQQYRMPAKVNCNIGASSKPVNVKQSSPSKTVTKTVFRKSYSMKQYMDSDCDGNELLLQHVIEMGLPQGSSEKKSLHSVSPKKPEFDPSQFLFHCINNMRDNCPDGISDGDEDDALLEKCIRAGMPSPKLTQSMQNRLPILYTKNTCQKQQLTPRPLMTGYCSEPSKKTTNSIRLPHNQPYATIHSNGTWISSTSFIDVDSMRIYRTEDTPVLSPTASVSDLSSLSINESFLNNSRNSDCSSDSDDDELLQQCIRSGMPDSNRAVA